MLKEDRYSELTMDLIDKGYRVHFFAIEVGARGLVGRSSYTFLREIGTSDDANKLMVSDLQRQGAEKNNY